MPSADHLCPRCDEERILCVIFHVSWVCEWESLMCISKSTSISKNQPECCSITIALPSASWHLCKVVVGHVFGCM